MVSISFRQRFGSKWLYNDVGPPFSRLQILLTGVHPNLPFSDVSEAGYLYQVTLLTKVLKTNISFVCYQSLSFLLAACSVFIMPIVRAHLRPPLRDSTPLNFSSLDNQSSRSFTSA